MKTLYFCDISKFAVYQCGSDFRTFVYSCDEIYENTAGLEEPMGFKNHIERTGGKEDYLINGEWKKTTLDEKKRLFILRELDVERVIYVGSLREIFSIVLFKSLESDQNS